MRLTQSAARARKLAAPAVMFAFDILADEGGPLAGQTLMKRRAKPEAFAVKHLNDNGTPCASLRYHRHHCGQPGGGNGLPS